MLHDTLFIKFIPFARLLRNGKRELGSLEMKSLKNLKIILFVTSLKNILDSNKGQKNN
jgi:hypothetical protein